MKQFVIYGQPNCSYCEKAKALFDREHIEYDYITLTKENIEEVKTLLMNEFSKELKTVPQIFLTNGKEIYGHIGGYTELEEYLKDDAFS